MNHTMMDCTITENCMMMNCTMMEDEYTKCGCNIGTYLCDGDFQCSAIYLVPKHADIATTTTTHKDDHYCGVIPPSLNMNSSSTTSTSLHDDDVNMIITNADFFRNFICQITLDLMDYLVTDSF